MKEKIIQALLKHAEGHIQKHIANVNILLEKQVGVAEHPDTLETIEKELAIIAEYDDQVEMLKKHFIS
jgi:malonyl CoA-acyl carrier protein transacylase